jgi:hypothetical protein
LDFFGFDAMDIAGLPAEVGTYCTSVARFSSRFELGGMSFWF